MNNNKVLESFVSYCDSMKVGNEGFIKNLSEKKRKEKEERVRKIELFNKSKSKYKAVLEKIIKEYIREFRTYAKTCKSYQLSIYDDYFFTDNETRGYVEVNVSYDIDYYNDEVRNILNKIESKIRNKFKNEVPNLDMGYNEQGVWIGFHILPDITE